MLLSFDEIVDAFGDVDGGVEPIALPALPPRLQELCRELGGDLARAFPGAGLDVELRAELLARYAWAAGFGSVAEAYSPERRRARFRVAAAPGADEGAAADA